MAREPESFVRITQPGGEPTVVPRGDGTFALQVDSGDTGGGGGGGATTIADGADVALGTTTDAAATGNGSVVGILKRLRTLLNGGLPAALGAGGGLKVDGSGTSLPVKQTARKTGVEALAGSWAATVALSWAAGLQSLATSATVGQASAEVDLTAEGADDVQVTVYVTMTTAGTPTGYVDVYVLTSVDGTTYSGDTSYSGTAAAYTLGAAGSPNPRWAGSIKPHANTNKYACEFSLRSVLGYVPAFFAVVVVNNSAIALHSSGNGADYRARY